MMNNKKNQWLFSLVAVSLLSMGVLVSPVPSLATEIDPDSPHFTCRASALRADKLLGSIFEPVVANPAEDPCKTDSKVLLEVLLGTNSNIAVLGALTEDTKAPVTSQAFAVDVNLLNLVSAEVLEATARVKSVNGQCVLSSESSVTSAVVNGIAYNLVNNHLDVPIPGVGTLHFNHTQKSPNKITQRALWLQITNPLLQETTGVKNVIVGEAIADFEDGNPCAQKPPFVNKRRMTGGGKFTHGTTTVTHGFVLHCNPARLPNNLQVNWKGNKFHLESLSSASCSDDPSIDPGKPFAKFDTHKGKGTRKLNGIPGATAEWIFTDAGEPGDNDSASILIKDKNGKVVLDISDASLLKGNHQAHNN